MNFGMPAAAPPATMPRKRKPFNILALPPEMQAQLAGGQPIQFEDGSTVYPDGTAEGAGDSPDDFTSSPAASMPGGMGDMPMGEPPLPPPGDDFGTGPKAAFRGPQFDSHFARRDAEFPGTPGGVGGGPLEDEDLNPMEDPLPDPFEVPEPGRTIGGNPDLGAKMKSAASESMSGGETSTKRKKPIDRLRGRRGGTSAGPATRPSSYR
jgi:hypothetical protein